MIEVDVVVLGLSPTGLYAVRELGRAGLRVGGLATEFQTGCKSKYLNDLVIEPDRAQQLNILQQRYSSGAKKPFLLPTSDQDVEFLMQHSAALAARYQFQASYLNENAQQFLTKSRFYERCAQLGIAYPQQRACRAHELLQQAESIGFPCFVKPSRIQDVKQRMLGDKGWVVVDQNALGSLAARLPESDDVFLIQEIVPGPESNISLFAAYIDGSGELHAAFTAHKLRQYPPGFGSASLAMSVHDEETSRLGASLLKQFNHVGIAAVEFKRDPRDGVLKVIEVNPRPSLWFALSERAGVNIAYTAYCDLTGEQPLPASRPQTNHVLWQYAIKDRYSSLFYRFNKDFVIDKPLVTPKENARIKVDAVFAPDDWQPLLAEYAGLLAKAFQRGRKRIAKRDQ
jgi:D-aspartate ligase